MDRQENKNLTTNYWQHNDDGHNSPQVTDFAVKRLIQGIDIKDLCDGKEVIIKISNDQNGVVLKEDEETFDEFIYCDPKTLREKRGAPPLNCKFSEFAGKMINVTEDGRVKKQVINPGAGKIVPDRAYVTIHYNMYKENCDMPFDSTYMRNRPEKFRLGQGESIVGLDYAIKSMKKNENSCFFIKWELAYGVLGCPDRIEPKCDIIVDVTLINFVEMENELDISDFTQEQLDQIDFNKSMSQIKQMIIYASEEFAKGDTRAAIVTYKKVLRILNNLRLANEEQEKLFLEKKVKALVNLAVCYNKLGRYEQACVACQGALSIDSHSVKANFHYGKANLALSNFKKAREYLLRADRIKPNDEDINKELKKLNDKKTLQNIADKIFWKKAFDDGNEIKPSPVQEEVPCALESFEQSLRKSLEESLKEKKPYFLPGPLLEDEKQICTRLAKTMNLNFGTQEDFFLFRCSDENSPESSN